MTRLACLEDVARIARICREAQRVYFRERTPINLRAAKAAENLLDGALADLDLQRLEPKARA